MSILAQYDIPWMNGSADLCPPYGVFQINGWEEHQGAWRLIGAKPTTGLTGPFAINGYGSVAAGKTGRCNVAKFPCWAAWTGTNTPKHGEPYAAVSAYQLRLFTGADWMCLGKKNTDSGLNLILVVPCQQKIWQGTAVGQIPANNQGSWQPQVNEVNAGPSQAIWLKWADGDQPISAGKQLFAHWQADQKRWVTLGADCE